MRRDVLRVVVITLLLLGLAVPLAAQGSVTGSVRGTVKDPDGGVLPGVTVTATSDQLVAGKLTAVTDERGVYRFPSLPPGTYAIEAELSGFRTARQDGVRISLGQALAVDLVMSMAAMAEEITVTAEAPLVSVVSNSVSSSFDADYLNKSPIPRNYYNIIRSAPGVNIDYRQSSGSAMLAYGGTQERQNAFTLDGVNVADAGAGQHWILPAVQWMQEIQVAGLGAAAEYGGFTGGIINGVTKSGGNEFHGEAEVYYQPESWTADNDPENDNEVFKFSDVAVSLGGPVVKDKLWYFASVEYWNQITTPVGAVDTSDREIPRFLGKLTYQASEANRFMFMAEYEGLVNERRGIGEFVLPEASRKQDAPGVTFALHWENLVNANNFFNVKVTGYDGRDDYLPYNGSDTPGRVDYWDSEVDWYNAQMTDKNYRRVLTLDGSWSLYKDGLLAEDDSHSFKVGFLVEDGRSSDQWLRNGGFTYYDDSTVCDSPEAYFADPSCAVSSDAFIERGYGEYDTHTKFSGLALYAQDSLRLDRWTVNVGARYGSYKGGWQDGHGDSTVYDVKFVDPRIGLVWDVFGTSRTAVKVHWGRYHEKMFNYLFDREVSGQGVIPDQDCYWNDDDGDYTDCDEAVVQLGTMGEVNHPYADEMLLSIEQQFGKDMMIGVDFIDRKFRDIMAMINVNDDYTEVIASENPLTGEPLPIYVLNSPQEYVLTTDNSAYGLPNAYRDYQALMLRFEKRYSHGWQVWSSFVWTDLKGNQYSNDGYISEFQDLNGFTYADGKVDLSYNEYDFKLNASVDLPLNLQLSGQYNYMSGMYWTPYVRVRRGLDYNSVTGRYVNLLPRGSNQFPDRNLVNLRLAWRPSLGGKLRLTVSAEVFNVTNSSTTLGVDGQWGNYDARPGRDTWDGPWDTFGQTTAIESPRQYRAGIRFEF